jgi:ANTAR domain/GAF domain
MKPAANSSNRELIATFEMVAMSLIAAPDSRSAFDAILELGVATVAGAEYAGITLFRRGQFETPAASGELPRLVDAIQYELGSGPCVDAVLDDTIYRTGDLSCDTRWPEFGTRTVAETGVISMLSFRLFLEDDDALAALNFYSTYPDAFPENTTLTGGVFATHAAIALAAAGRRERISNLEQALDSNREIGVAMGVLMSRQLLTREQAFDLLRMTSQRTHRKLRDVAYDVVETGALDLSALDFGADPAADDIR